MTIGKSINISEIVQSKPNFLAGLWAIVLIEEFCCKIFFHAAYVYVLKDCSAFFLF